MHGHCGIIPYRGVTKDMKKLLILNGIMGAGKSSFIKENKLEDFTVSSDELRIKMAGFDMSENGLVISSKHDRQVWSMLYTILESRMNMGLFTVVDAMHLHTRDFKKYKELADLYGYEIVHTFDVYEKYEKPLVAAGWDVIVFVPSLEEDEDRITCGNSLIALENSKKKEN